MFNSTGFNMAMFNMATSNTGHLIFRRTILAISLVSLITPTATADDAARTRRFDASVAKAIRYLRTQGQADDGSFNSVAGPGITAVVTTGLLRHGRRADDPMVAKALKYLEGFVREDGGIYRGKLYRNYETCLSILCFAEANTDGRYDKLLKNAENYARGLQWGKGLEDSDRRRGGQGYGRHKRPDLSNTNFFIDALKSMGAGEDDPAIRAALKFVSECQNHESQHNTGKTAAKSPDGGFIYTPDYSQAGELANGGLRSYASMTYAGLKSMIFAGVDSDDSRVKAAVAWVKKNYDLTSNPGMGSNGLYYYYHTFAKALDALGQETITDAAGKRHNWRHELIDALSERQNKDGSWTNKNPRWLEGDPSLVTGYALLALSYCQPESK